MHSFEDLKDASWEALKHLRDEVRGSYANERQRRWNLIAEIMFYSKELDKLKDEQHD